MFNTKPVTAPNNNQRPSADAFLNLQIEDANGNKHAIRAGVPLHLANKLEESMILAEQAKEGTEFKLTGTIKIIVPEADKPAVNF